MTVELGSVAARRQRGAGNLLGVGVIGVGYPGERHAEGCLESGLTRLIAASDLDETKLAAFSSTYGAKRSYEDYRRLLANADVDIVVVALPTFLHQPVTLAALKAGKHVLCEKPPARSAAEVEGMERAAEASGNVLGYALQRRFGATAQKLRELLARDELGEVYHARAVWRRTWGVPAGLGGASWFTDPVKAGGGALMDIGVHVLDLAWFLLGLPGAASVSGRVFNKFPDLTKTDDSAFAFVRFESGQTLQLETSWVLAQAEDEFAVHLYGTKAGAHLTEERLDLFPVSRKGRMRRSFDVAVNPPLRVTEPFTSQLQDFARAVSSGAEPCMSASQGTQLMRMIAAIYESSKLGQEVTCSR